MYGIDKWYDVDYPKDVPMMKVLYDRAGVDVTEEHDCYVFETGKLIEKLLERIEALEKQGNLGGREMEITKRQLYDELQRLRLFRKDLEIAYDRAKDKLEAADSKVEGLEAAYRKYVAAGDDAPF